MNKTGSTVISHNKKFSIRVINEGPAEADIRALVAIEAAVKEGMEKLNLPGHLFVTALYADSIATSEHDCGFACYWDGMQSVLIAASKPEEWPESHDDWLKSLRESVLHELVHYKQDLEGRLTGSPENEEEAEKLATTI